MGELGGGRAGRLRSLAGRELDVGPLLDRLEGRWPWVIVGVGVLLRLAQYAWDVPFWMDEHSLAANIRPGSRGGLLGPLHNTQLATPGFLAAERLACLALGDSRRALRVVPLLAGVAALATAVPLCRRGLRPAAGLIALGLIAASDDLIAFSAELKQYEVDVAAALFCTLAGLAVRGGPVSPARALGFAAAGAGVVWFSHPSAFVLAGVGTTLTASAASRSDRAGLVPLALASLAWAASFAAVYVTAMAQLGHRPDMWHFWGFAFPPMPPTTAWDATWAVRRFVYLFVNPMSFTTPLGARLSAVPPLAFFAAGCLSMRRRDPELFAVLMTPALFTLLASCLHLYPFHGRLVLFLVPSFLVVIAEGAGRAVERFDGRAARAAVLASLFLWPTLQALYHLGVPRSHDSFNPYGDRRPDSDRPERFPF